jgi:hypothetical protein
MNIKLEEEKLNVSDGVLSCLNRIFPLSLGRSLALGARQEIFLPPLRYPHTLFFPIVDLFDDFSRVSSRNGSTLSTFGSSLSPHCTPLRVSCKYVKNASCFPNYFSLFLPRGRTK